MVSAAAQIGLWLSMAWMRTRTQAIRSSSAYNRARSHAPQPAIGFHHLLALCALYLLLRSHVDAGRDRILRHVRL
jgi:hypothetical protein